jgi:hypothetical protein
MKKSAKKTRFETRRHAFRSVVRARHPSRTIEDAAVRAREIGDIDGDVSGVWVRVIERARRRGRGESGERRRRRRWLGERTAPSGWVFRRSWGRTTGARGGRGL